jgi:3-oxoacyl-[acyl-carrier-protein] synthase-3
VVVVGGDKMSSIIDYEDRATCIIFGDGCGAVLLEPNTEGLGVMDSHPAQRWQRLPIPAPEGRWQHASGHRAHRGTQGALRLPGRQGRLQVRRDQHGRRERGDHGEERPHGGGRGWLVPHQANKRIIDATANRMGLDEAK